MANVLTGRVFNLDTASPGTVIFTGMVNIKGVRWDGATNAGHKAVLNNRHGELIWKSTAAGVNNEDAGLIEGWYDGLILETLDSGELALRIG